jgi:MFS family permease
MHGSLVSAIHMTEAQYGLVISSYSWVFGVASPFAGYLSDRISRKWVIVASMFIWSAVTFLTAYATSFPQLVVMRCLLALSEACYIPAAGVMIADYHRGPSRPLAAGIHLTGFFVGGMLGGIGGWMSERHSWSYAFSVVGIPSLIYTALLAVSLRDSPREGVAYASASGVPMEVAFWAAVKDLFSRGSFFIVLACVTLADIVGWIIVGWLPTFMAEHFKLDQSMAGFSATGCIFGMSAVGLIVGGAFTARLGRTTDRSCIYVPIAGLSISAVSMLVATNTHSLAIAIAGLLLFGLTASWFTTNVLPILCLVSEPRYRATGYGLINAIGMLVGGVLVYLTGVLRDSHFDLSYAFAFAAFCLILCAGLLPLINSTPLKPKIANEG